MVFLEKEESQLNHLIDQFMTIQRFSKLFDIPEIENFIEVIPIFASQEYADYLKKAKNYCFIWFYAYISPDTRLIIPFATRKKYIFKVGTFLTATISLNKKISVETEKKFLNSIIKLIKEDNLCDWIQQSPNWAIFRSYPDGAVFSPFGSYQINLREKSVEELFNSIQKKDRYDIKKAIKEGVEIKSGNNLLNEALVLIAATAKKANLDIPSITELTYLKDNIQIFISYHEGIPQSSAIFYTSKYAWYNMYAGLNQNPFRGANSLLYWSAIKHAKEKNVIFFDFVGARINPEPGSKQEKIQRFKEHFGVELFAGFLWKIQLNKFKYCIYNYSRRTFYLIKGKKFKGDIIDQEKERLAVF